MEVVVKLFFVMLGLAFVTNSAFAFECSPRAVIQNSDKMDIGLQEYFRQTIPGDARYNRIQLVSVKSTLLKVNIGNGRWYGGTRNGVWATYQVEGLTAKGTRVLFTDPGKRSTLRVWLKTQGAVVPGSEGSAAYCKVGIDDALDDFDYVNAETGLVFQHGHIGQLKPLHIDLGTGALYPGRAD